MLELNECDLEEVAGGLLPIRAIARFLGGETASYFLDQGYDYEKDHIGGQIRSVGRYQMGTGGLWAYGY